VAAVVAAHARVAVAADAGKHSPLTSICKTPRCESAAGFFFARGQPANGPTGKRVSTLSRTHTLREH
jgi:hypothetical protein